MTKIYYVYEHVRLDTNEVFYVGKGTGNRIKSSKNRNKHWRNIVSRCGYIGRVVIGGLDEEFAYLIEKELISKYKSLKVKLANYTDGGEGFSGNHSEQTKIKMSVSAKKRKRSLNPRPPISEETRKKLSVAKLGKPPHNKNKPHSDATKKKMSASKIGVFVGVKWWNDGKCNVRSVNCPGEHWVPGRYKKLCND